MQLLSHAGYKNDKPTLTLVEDATLVERPIKPTDITIRFDTSQRYCTGWHDLKTSESHACPDAAMVDAKYSECPACQRRTGFNPAFYHANSVSEQQDKRNREPHYLYLAYFAPHVVKVGISYSGRNHARLLEQGARAAYVLDTFPTALLARQYEAKISGIPGIAEHLTARKKRDLWQHQFDLDEAKTNLHTTLETINGALATSFTPEFINLNEQYFFGDEPTLRDVVDRTDDAMISGTILGCIGTELIVENDERLLSLNLKHYAGYPVTIKDTITAVDLPPAQATLF